MARILVFRPNFDLATSYGHAWLGEIAEYARSIGHEVMDIEGGNATQSAFFDAMENFKPDLAVSMGHGSPTLFSGQNVEIVLTSCQNDQVMSGSQAFFLSCLMGQTLARTMEEKKALAVGAYTQEFVWLTDSGYSTRILEDPVAYPFRRAVVEPTKRLMRDWNWRTWYDGQVKLFNQGIAEWWNSNDPSAGQIVAALEHDRDCLIVYGGNIDIAPGVVVSPPVLAVAEALFGAAVAGLMFL